MNTTNHEHENEFHGPECTNIKDIWCMPTLATHKHDHDLRYLIQHENWFLQEKIKNPPFQGVQIIIQIRDFSVKSPNPNPKPRYENL